MKGKKEEKYIHLVEGIMCSKVSWRWESLVWEIGKWMHLDMLIYKRVSVLKLERLIWNK